MASVCWWGTKPREVKHVGKVPPQPALELGSDPATRLQSLPQRLDYVIVRFAGGRECHLLSPLCDFKGS